ncbi:MAG: nitrous oxide reductase family maturation protein NosD [Thiohalomonadaceae bacterium]
MRYSKNRKYIKSVLYASVFAAGALLGTSGTATAANYYVAIQDSRASDSNPGTESAPWKTLYRVNQANLQPGDTVIVKPGVYEMTTGGTWASPIINPKNSGTANNPITFRAVPRHQAILRNAPNPILGSNGRDHIVIDGFFVKNVYGKGMVVYNADGVVIQNNIIEHVWSQSNGDNTDGIRVELANGTIVRNNEIRDIDNGAHLHYNAAGVKLYNASNSIIENNEIYDAGAGVYDKTGGKSNHIRRNYMHDCGSGLRFHSKSSEPTANVEMYQNVVNKCEIGFAVTDSVDTTLRVYNNVFANSLESAFKAPVGTTGGRHRIYNNIIYGPKAGSIALYAYEDPMVTMLTDYNLYVGEPVFHIGRYKTNRSFNSLAAYQAGTGRDTHSFVGDAAFVNAAKADFRLNNWSVAKNAGRVGGVSSGAPIDMGAYPTGLETIGLVSDSARPAPPVLLEVR